MHFDDILLTAFDSLPMLKILSSSTEVLLYWYSLVKLEIMASLRDYGLRASILEEFQALFPSDMCIPFFMYPIV